jgi:hypothetical protein
VFLVGPAAGEEGRGNEVWVGFGGGGDLFLLKKGFWVGWLRARLPGTSVRHGLLERAKKPVFVPPAWRSAVSEQLRSSYFSILAVVGGGWVEARNPGPTGRREYSPRSCPPCPAITRIKAGQMLQKDGIMLARDWTPGCPAGVRCPVEAAKFVPCQHRDSNFPDTSHQTSFELQAGNTGGVSSMPRSPVDVLSARASDGWSGALVEMAERGKAGDPRCNRSRRGGPRAQTAANVCEPAARTVGLKPTSSNVEHGQQTEGQVADGM